MFMFFTFVIERDIQFQFKIVISTKFFCFSKSSKISLKRQNNKWRKVDSEKIFSALIKLNDVVMSSDMESVHTLYEMIADNSFKMK